MERLSQLLGSQVQFSYTALDRIVLNGYIDCLQRPVSLIYFLHEVVGIPCIDPSALQSRTNLYRAWVRDFASSGNIPLLQSPKGARKEDLVLPYYRRLQGEEGVACILSSMEQSRTFVSYTPRFTPPSGNPDYRIIRSCRKRFLHYYFYVQDPVMGPMSLRIATYLPFTVTCFLNGHSFLAQELTRTGVRFRKEDNAFLAVDDLPALQAAVDRLTPAVLRERCNFWTSRLAPTFSPQEHLALNLSYRYSMAQVELATDVLFKRSAPLKALFRRAVDIGLLSGGADQTTYLFGRRINRRYQGKLQTVLERRDEGHPIIRSYYQTSFVKQYEKGDRLLRTETCINDPHHLNVGRPLENLPKLVERMAATNDRYLDMQADLLDSSVDAGQLAELARPTLCGHRRIPGLKLQDERAIRLLEVLLHPGGFVADWTSRDLHARLLKRHRLTEADYRLSQLRYDLTKLRAKELVERIGRTRRYRITFLGVKLGMVLVKAHNYLLGPLCTLASKPQRSRSTRHPSDVEAALRQVDTALDHLCEVLGLRAA